MNRDDITPDLEWASRLSGELGIPTRCPYANVWRCPRYYQSVSLLAQEKFTTPINPQQDQQLLSHWSSSHLWPETMEKATAISGAGDKRSFTNFCPEVAFDRFGYFAGALFPYHDELDLEAALRTHRIRGSGHWFTTWSHVEALHYSECPLYSLLQADLDIAVTQPASPGFLRKIAVLGKDYYSLRTIDDLFIFAGADPGDRMEPEAPQGSERMDRVYGWARGIEARSPGRLNDVLVGVAAQMVDNTDIPEGDRAFLRREGHVPTLLQAVDTTPELPSSIEQLLERIIRGLPRATRPLRYRRKGSAVLEFSNEYDLQSLFHSLISPWVKDIRPEEYTPSYAGSSTRIDFLLADHDLVVELKFVRDRSHATKVGNELVLDVAHYRAHPSCRFMWAVIYDPEGLISNPDGLRNDLDGEHKDQRGSVTVKTLVLQP